MKTYAYAPQPVIAPPAPVRTASVTATLVRGKPASSYRDKRLLPSRDVYRLTIQTYGRNATKVYTVTMSLDDMVDAARAALADHYKTKMSDWRITRAAVDFTSTERRP